jgi:uncharacterized protein YybS (DUF2232 family)
MQKDILKALVITASIVELALYLPFMGFFLVPFVPLPVLFYRMKFGRKSAGMIAGMTSLVMLLSLKGMTIDMLLFTELLFLGFMMGECFEKNFSVEKSILYSSGAVLLSGACIIFIYSSLSSIGIIELVSKYLNENAKLSLSMYKELGVEAEDIEFISNSMDKILYVLVRILPSFLIAFTLVIAWLNLLMARGLLRVKNIFFPDFGALNKWHSPESLVWCIIASGLCLILPVQSIKIFGMNILILMLVVYFFQGIAILSFYFEKKQVSRMFKICFYLFILMQQLFILLVAVMGLFDVWGDFRKLKNVET